MSPSTQPSRPPNASRAISTPARLIAATSSAWPWRFSMMPRPAERVGDDAVGARFGVAALDRQHALGVSQVPGLAAVPLLEPGDHQLRAHGAVAEQRSLLDSCPAAVCFCALSPTLSSRGQREMNRLEHQAPLVLTAVRLAVAAGSRCWPGPARARRSTAGRCSGFSRSIATSSCSPWLMYRHMYVCPSSPSAGRAALLANRIAVALRTERDAVLEAQRRPCWCTSCLRSGTARRRFRLRRAASRAAPRATA